MVLMLLVEKSAQICFCVFKGLHCSGTLQMLCMSSLEWPGVWRERALLTFFLFSSILCFSLILCVVCLFVCLTGLFCSARVWSGTS